MFEQVSESAGRSWKLWLVLAVLAFALLASLIWVLRMTRMPLKSYSGQLPPLTNEQLESASHLSQHVKYLSETIGERNLSKAGTLQKATDYFQSQLRQGGNAVAEQTYMVQGHQVRNLEVKLPGTDAAGETVVIGAHYDSVAGAPGADDNASGAAGVLELARLLHGSAHRKTIRLVLFVNEEPPFFQTESMGSLVYARQLRTDHVSVSAMISLEMLGFYSDVSGSQKYPVLLGLFYPDRGNFIAIVGNPGSRTLVRQVVRSFRETTQFPSEGIAAPADWPGVGWSDHWSFWQKQYPAIMITDTALFRYPYYHTPFDTADRVDFDKMARVVEGVRRVVESLATDP
jgi:Zn-dependent M28 family amino/carboxypeptidase